jgi:hypothetical protein
MSPVPALERAGVRCGTDTRAAAASRRVLRAHNEKVGVLPEGVRERAVQSAPKHRFPGLLNYYFFSKREKRKGFHAQGF